MSDRINILNKQGLLTDEDRKQPLEHGFEHFTFKTCLDLSKSVQLIPYGNSEVISLENYTKDIASFIVWWSHFVMKDLNGFSGFHNVKFELPPNVRILPSFVDKTNADKGQFVKNVVSDLDLALSLSYEGRKENS